MSPTRKRVLGGAGALFVIVVAVIIVYAVFIKSDPEPPLTLNSVASSTTVTGAASGSTAATTTVASNPNLSASNLDGSWNITTASQVGYRVTEDLVGGLANNVAVGRTNAVTGTVTIAGTSATAVDATADLTKLKSDSDRRDGQVQSRILNTAQFPKATFKLTTPINFGSVPAVAAEKKASATGDLTIHGVTKMVTFDVTYTLVSANEIRMLGSVAMKWADFTIPSPTFAGVADVRDNGQMEFLIVATR
jgi:polyisoprenoid-binding protein YceI